MEKKYYIGTFDGHIPKFMKRLLEHDERGIVLSSEHAAKVSNEDVSIWLVEYEESEQPKPIEYSDLSILEKSLTFKTISRAIQLISMNEVGDMYAFNGLNIYSRYNRDQKKWVPWKLNNRNASGFIERYRDHLYEVLEDVSRYYSDCAKVLKKIQNYWKNATVIQFCDGAPWEKIDFSAWIAALEKRAFDVCSIDRMENIIRLAEKM